MRSGNTWLLSLALAALTTMAGEANEPITALVIADSDDKEQSAALARAGEALAKDGIRLEVVSDLSEWDAAASHSKYPVAILAAQEQSFDGPRDREVRKLVSTGGGLILMGTCGDCFYKEAAYTSLAGATFASFSSKIAEFEVRPVDGEHEVTAGLKPFNVTGPKIGHMDISEKAAILLERDGEPWAWALPLGKGRVVYTTGFFAGEGSGEGGFTAFLRNAIRWAAKQ